MKKLILFGILVWSLTFSYAQDVVTLKHTYYTSIFIPSKHIPRLVEYTLTKEMLTCPKSLPRTKFTPDPHLPEATNINEDYKGTHLDRGHNMSAQDNRCDKTGMQECFYFSNMFPQTHSLNAGVWKTLETFERKEAIQYGSIRVSIGSIGESKTIGANMIVVPEFCWKVIYIPSSGEYQCYIFPNTKIEDKKLDSYKKEISEIQTKGKVIFIDGFATPN